ncbi:MAG: hypothetical protein OEO21_10150, partial [Candidatus Krumholzibacteria bacterium]|nr:hypothetical protein [Candidatus Krumholzibacteria bacterium]
VDAPSWQYEARRTDADGEEVLMLTIRSSLCVDSTSGAESPLRAVLVREGRRLEGCAVAGRSTRRAGTE